MQRMGLCEDTMSDSHKMGENMGMTCNNELLLFFCQKMTERSCLCSLKLDINFLEQDILIKLTNQAKLSVGRDEILARLSLLTEIFEATHCRAVKMITQSLLNNTHCLCALEKLLENEDSLVAYCACKCLGAAIINCQGFLPDDYLVKTLIRSIQELASDSKNLSSLGNVNKAIYILGTLKQVLRCTRDTDSEQKKSPCMDGTQSQDSDQAILQHFQRVEAELPSIMSTFLLLTKSLHQNSDEKTTKISLKLTDYSLILMEFLEFTHEAIKCAITFDTQKCTGEVNYQILHGFERISEFLWLDNLTAVNMKTILDISNCILDYILDSKCANQNQDMKLTAVGMLVMKQVLDGWLERIEYRNVALGFGGPLIAGQRSIDEFCSGDHPLLRQLVRLWMSVAVVVLNDKQQSESVLPVQSSMAVLSRCITNKLSMDKDAAFNKWIFALFCDQDDSLILIMLRAVQLYKLLQSKLHAGKTEEIKLKSESVNSIDILNLTNPYLIFVNFLESINFDPNLLLDLLMSNETCFLEYLVQFIRLTLTNWEEFATFMKKLKLASQDDSEVEDEKSEEDETEGEDSVIKGSDDFDVQEIEEKQEQTHILRTNDDAKDRIEKHKPNLYSEEQCTETYVGRTGDIRPVPINTSENSDQLDLNDKVIDIQGKTFVNTNDGNDDEISPKCKKMKWMPSKHDSSFPLNFQTSDLNTCLNEEPNDLSIIAKNLTLDEVMTVLIRLRISVEKMSVKGLFPYNIVPLLRLLEQMEVRYEQ